MVCGFVFLLVPAQRTKGRKTVVVVVECVVLCVHVCMSMYVGSCKAGSESGVFGLCEAQSSRHNLGSVTHTHTHTRANTYQPKLRFALAWNHRDLRPASLPAVPRVCPIGVRHPAATESATGRRRHWHAASVVHRQNAQCAHYYYYIRLTAFFQDNLGKPAPEGKPFCIYWSKG